LESGKRLLKRRRVLVSRRAWIQVLTDLESQMRTQTRRVLTVIAVTALAASATAACTSSNGAGDHSSTSGPEHAAITVAIPGTYNNDDGKKYFAQRLSAFRTANPTITVTSKDVQFDPTTFQAMVAGQNLPTTMEVPFTEIQSLIANKQIADLTDPLEAAGLTAQLNPVILGIAKSQDGAIYGVPSNSYSVGLNYNRALFVRAGLDPDKPPMTWDEVRTDAKKITAATGVPGFGQMAKDGSGGWMFSAETYGFGGTIENSEGNEATFDDTPSKKFLTALQQMKWADGSVSKNALYDYGGIVQDLAAGKLGMFVGAPDMYAAAVYNFGMKPADFGAGGLPQDGSPKGTLNGGAVEVVSPQASKAQRAAALKWIDFFYLSKYTNRATAVDDAKTKASSKNAVGLPGLPPVSEANYNQYLEWIKPYVNVPVENFTPYLATVPTIPLVPEPKKKAQEVYAAMDTVLQTVMTKQGANIDALLASAADAINAKLSR
jgi:multiple sugar transport system substrate-binding protein